MTPVVKCVPPDNKPSLLEIRTCRRYLVEEFQCLKSLKTVLALGSVAFYSYLKLAESLGESVKASFKHGAIVRFVTLPTLFASYHPSPQNTYTGKLTLPMLKDVLTTAEREWQGL